MTIPVIINGTSIASEPNRTILETCRANGVYIPTLCYMEGLSTIGACRLCLVEIGGSPRLLPACTTKVAPNMEIRTNTTQLREYVRMTVELLFSERNHVCSVCVANGNCELQDLAQTLGVTKVRFPYLNPDCHLDASHPLFNMDHNRCVMCRRCVRTCDEVEGAHTWDVSGRGAGSRIISDFNQPWGESISCTSCGKCEQVCPVGAIWPKSASQGNLPKTPERITELIERRGRR